MTDEEIAQLHEYRDDPDEWDDESIEIAVDKPVGNVVSLQLSANELDRAVAAADELGISLAEFIRGALAQRIDEAKEKTPV